jgi:hypothetical protein
MRIKRSKYKLNTLDKGEAITLEGDYNRVLDAVRRWEKNYTSEEFEVSKINDKLIKITRLR